MKFFTREWHAGNVPEKEAESIPKSYWAHISTLLPSMPVAVRALAQSINLHDGRIRHIALDGSDSTVIMGLRCGDLQEGYYDLDLRYGDVDTESTDLNDLLTSANNAEVEVLYDEIDRGEGQQWVHRILFWPYREVCIVFGRLGLHLEPRESRE